MSKTFTTHAENPAASQVMTFLMSRGLAFSVSFNLGVCTWITDYIENGDLSPIRHFFTSTVTDYTKPSVEANLEAVTAPQEHVTFVQPEPVETKKSWSRRPKGR